MADFDVGALTATEAITRRPTLTNKAYDELGLPRVADAVVVPVVDLPWYFDRRAES